MKEKKIAWILTASHNIYKGWIKFFNENFDLEVYDDCLEDYDLKNKRFKNINLFFKKIIYGNDILIIKDPIKDKKEYKFIIIGEIFINLLSFKYIFNKNILFYSEFFFKKSDSIFKKILFYIWTLFFRNKKFIVPTLNSYNSFKKISKNVLYFPQIYNGDILINNSLQDSKLKILFVGNLGGETKNLNFLLNSLLKIKNNNIEIGLCGRMEGFDSKFDFYKEQFGNDINYYGFLGEEELSKLYLKHNLFILPSTGDAIGSVIIEAMAHSMPIIVSENVGASSYIKNGVNGFIFNNNNEEDLLNKINFFIDSENKKIFGNHSIRLVKEFYSGKNKKLLNLKKEEILNFMK